VPLALSGQGVAGDVGQGQRSMAGRTLDIDQLEVALLVGALDRLQLLVHAQLALHQVDVAPPQAASTWTRAIYRDFDLSSPF
jgi:hypothetical protein